VTPRLALPGAALAAALLVGGSASAAKPPTATALISKGLAAAVASGDLEAGEASAYGAMAKAAAAEVKRLKGAQADTLRGTLQDIAALWRGYTRPRALILFSTLALNMEKLAAGPPPRSGTDVTDESGIVYRFFSGHGYVFHPLANFARLNVLAQTDDPGLQTLANALIARAVPAQGGLVWEYLFPFARGHPPWISGMAQAVAAQAFARAGDMLSDPALLDAADAAYATIPGKLVRGLPAGPWIKLYSFDASPVLNAQLQTAISLGDYAEIAGNADAAALVDRLLAAAETLLPRFDTGYWSLYALQGGEAPLGYHEFVVSLLRKLAARTGDATWREFADRFQGYEGQPPIVRLGKVTPTVYAVPAEGRKAEARFPFWLSKLSTVTLKIAGRVQTSVLGLGSHTLVYSPGNHPPATLHPGMVVTDVAGNKVAVSLPPVEIRHGGGSQAG
jgi:hypothetical protein